MSRRIQVKKALAIAAIGASATFLSPNLSGRAYAASNKIPVRNYARSFAVSKGMVHHHRGGHSLNKHSHHV